MSAALPPPYRPGPAWARRTALTALLAGPALLAGGLSTGGLFGAGEAAVELPRLEEPTGGRPAAAARPGVPFVALRRPAPAPAQVWRIRVPGQAAPSEGGWSLRGPARRARRAPELLTAWGLGRYRAAAALRAPLTGGVPPPEGVAPAAPGWGLAAGLRLAGPLVVHAEGPRRTLVSLPPAYEGPPGRRADAWVDGLSYADPLGAGLPLLRVAGYEAHRVSAHFDVRDFASRDGAPLVRISPALVAGLEGMRALVGPFTIISGYRHPAHNLSAHVRGSRSSRHQSGQAADVWSPTASSTELAQAAVRAMGCGVGLGLGRNTLHVDVRGALSTWTYPGAPLGEAAFDRWIRDLCGGAVPAAPAPAAVTWLSLVGGGARDGVDEAEQHMAEAAAEAAPVVREAPAELALDALVRLHLGRWAREAYRRSGAGVVVVDLTDGAAPAGAALERRAHYAGAATPEVAFLGLPPLVRWTEEQGGGAFFAYAVRLPGRVVTGVAPTAEAAPPRADPLRADPRAPAPAPPAAPPAAPAPSAPAPSAAGPWTVVVATTADLGEAEAALARYGAALAPSGLAAVLHVEGAEPNRRFRVTAGRFASEAAARQGLERVRPLAPHAALWPLDR